jgi:acyl carrier protein
MTTIEKLQNVFQDVFDDPSIRLTPEFSPSFYGDWDSLATVRLVLSIESEFGMRFTTDQVAKIRSVRDMLSVLEPLSS